MRLLVREKSFELSYPFPGGSLLTTLKEELFTLETDRLEGRLTDSEYEQHKQALELVLRRALAKKPA